MINDELDNKVQAPTPIITESPSSSNISSNTAAYLRSNKPLRRLKYCIFQQLLWRVQIQILIENIHAGGRTLQITRTMVKYKN